MLYEYENASGQRLGIDFSMGEAPEALRRNGETWRRVWASQRPLVSQAVTAYSLPDRRVMPAQLAGKVDAWTTDGAPVFTSKASAKRFSDESARLHAKGEIKQEWHFDRAPSGAEVRQAREAEVKKYRADMLKRPRPKGF